MRNSFLPIRCNNYAFLYPNLLLIFTFILSRIIYKYSWSETFDATPLTYFLQYIDVELLRHDLLRSIFYLHQQPPLFNLYLGVTLKIFPTSYVAAFAATYFFMGIGLCLCLYHLMLSLHIKPAIALVLAVLYIISPTNIMYQNWLFYSYPAAFLVTACALFLIKFLKTERVLYGVLFFSVLAILILTRGLFHPVGFAVAVIVLYYFCASLRKKIAYVMLVPFIFVLLFSIKQYVFFNTISAGTSYLGQNLAVRTAKQVPQSKQGELLAIEGVPAFFFHFPTKRFSFYRPYLPPIPKTGIPVLDSMDKETENVYNFNYYGLFAQSDAYLKGFFAILSKFPGYYLNSFKRTKTYFAPANDYYFVYRHTVRNFRVLLKKYNTYILLKPRESRLSYVLLFGMPTLLLFGALYCVHCYIKTPKHTHIWITLGFMLSVIVGLSLITVVISWGDYNRYRFTFDSFYVVLLGLLLTTILDYIRDYKLSCKVVEILND